MKNPGINGKRAAWAALGLLAFAGMAAGQARIAPGYHSFWADAHGFMGRLGGSSVWTNCFFFAAAAHLWFGRVSEGARTKWLALYCLGLAAAGAGSCIYHAAPGAGGLLADWIGMSAAFGPLAAALWAPGGGQRPWHSAAFFCMFALSACASYALGAAGAPWALAPWAAMQAWCAAGLALMPARPGRGWAWAALGAYALAKALEMSDALAGAWTGIGGHDWKHLAAAAGAWCAGAWALRSGAALPKKGG